MELMEKSARQDISTKYIEVQLTQPVSCFGEYIRHEDRKYFVL